MEESNEDNKVAPLGTLEGQIFLTAGPRKDTEAALGEDSGGLLMRSDACYFWIADGTSQGEHRGPFTPRLLALELGAAFCAIVQQENPAATAGNVKDVFDRVLETVRSHWETQILEAQKENPDLYQTTFDVSSVFLCGWLTARRQLQAVTYGDAWLYLEKVGSIRKIERNDHRFFLRWHNVGTANETQWRVDTTRKHQHAPPLLLEEVAVVACGSDGASEIRDSVEAASTQDREILHLVERTLKEGRAKTHDDKTLCILRVF